MQKPQNIKGMRDHLPQAMRLRQHILDTLTSIFAQYGFEPLSTPVLEYAETLEGKLGDEEKLIYRFEDHGGRKLALRYDQTVPLARVVAQYANEITLPWRRYAIGASYRGERPARGRYREFWQADIDIVGSASPLADAEIVAVLTDSLRSLGFPSFKTLLNHRQILGGIARFSGLDEAASAEVYRAIDKLDKIGADGVQEELERNGVQTAQAKRILAMVMAEGSSADMLRELETHLCEDTQAMAALDNIRAILTALSDMGISAEHYQLSPRLARGLSYYTGAVFEAVSSHWPQGSLLGGGRYDDLVGIFARRPIPTVGLAFGIDRLHDVMQELGIGPQQCATAEVFVTIFNPEQTAASLNLAHLLRTAGIPTIISLEAATSLGKQMKEADRKGARLALVLGPDEEARQEVVVKDLRSGEQQPVARDAVVQEVQKRLGVQKQAY
jgi:histidyl-tRNA synthetase